MVASITAVCLSLLVTRGVHGQTAVDAKRLLAQALFEQGRDDLARGEYAIACKKLSESRQLDTAAGTLLNLALCHEMEQKTASAWAEYKEVVAISEGARDEERGKIAAERIRVLEPKLSYLTIRVPAQMRLPGLVISLDGVPIGEGAWDTELPTDPGTHALLASASGRTNWSATIRIDRDAQRHSLTIPSNALPPQISPSRIQAVKQTGRMTSAQVVGLSALGFGSASILVGGYFGLQARASWQKRNEHCSPDNCDASAVEAWREAKRYATLADLTLALGVAAVGSGIYLMLAPTKNIENSHQIGVRTTGGGVIVDVRGAL